MRLVKNIERLEAHAAGVPRNGPVAPVGLVWTRNESRIDAAALQPGEYIAADVTILETCEPAEQDGAAIEPPHWWAITERITRDANDLGVVSNWLGRALGCVVELDGALLVWRAFGSGMPAAMSGGAA